LKKLSHNTDVVQVTDAPHLIDAPGAVKKGVRDVLLDTPPLNAQGLFWIDPEKDFPAHALIRRIPSPEAQVLYFSCDTQAELALKHRAELAKDIPAELIGLPKFADTHAGPGVLLRLNHLWGHPAKRRFPRRRQSYRANLCSVVRQLFVDYDIRIVK
jgi:hypothetical protein